MRSVVEDYRSRFDALEADVERKFRESPLTPEERAPLESRIREYVDEVGGSMRHASATRRPRSAPLLDISLASAGHDHASTATVCLVGLVRTVSLRYVARALVSPTEFKVRTCGWGGDG